MSEKKVVTYPRGFLGYDIGLSIEPKGDTIKDALKNTTLNRGGNDLRLVISNKNVEGIWKKINIGEQHVDSFDTREKILCNALIAFGCESLLDWFELQTNNPNQTDLHRRFLNDTLNFINCGTRVMSIHSWAAIIQVREVTNKDAHPPLKHRELLSGHDKSDSNVNTHMGIYKSINNIGGGYQNTARVNHLLVNAIPQWVWHKGGFHDLAGTMHVLFGDYGVS